jgi:hypothetical protein
LLSFNGFATNRPFCKIRFDYREEKSAKIANILTFI